MLGYLSNVLQDIHFGNLFLNCSIFTDFVPELSSVNSKISLAAKKVDC